MYLGMALIYAGLAIGFDGPIAFALFPLVLIALQTQVITAWHGDSTHALDGDEDAACADYIEALLTEENPDPTPYLARITASTTGALFLTNTRPEYPATDLPYCTQLDCLAFALPIQRQPNGLLTMKPLPI
jgi:hypothetical protein